MDIVHIQASARRPAALLIVMLGASLLTGAAAGAQELPSAPLSLAGGRVTVGADVSFSTATENDHSAEPAEAGWFNYTDYEHSTMRLARVGVTGDVRVTERVSFLAEIR